MNIRHSINTILCSVSLSLLLPLSHASALETATQTQTHTALSLATITGAAVLANHYLKSPTRPPSPLPIPTPIAHTMSEITTSSAANLISATVSSLLSPAIAAPAPTIVDYDPACDCATIIPLFQNNWKELGKTCVFNADAVQQLLHLKTPELELRQYYGKMRIKVLHNNNAVIGFVSYYRYDDKDDHTGEEIKCGMIHHLVVDDKFRNNGHGARLLNVATEDLKTMGASRATLSIADTATIPFYKKYAFALYRIVCKVNEVGDTVPLSCMLAKPI